jgi:hypothetical protein
MNLNVAMATQEAPASPLEFEGVTRPRLSFDANGDAFVFERFKGGALVAVIDGLGHGERAQRSTEVAVRCLQSHPGEPLATLFCSVAKACRATDGVVMAAARFEFSNAITFSFASVGNVEARLFLPRNSEHSPAKSERLIVRRGILGGKAPEPHVTAHVWSPGNVLVLHSDGVSGRWSLEDFPGWRHEPAGLMAQEMLVRLANDDDDATLVVVREPLPV